MLPAAQPEVMPVPTIRPADPGQLSATLNPFRDEYWPVSSDLH
jgi:hypothetical protein